MNDSRYQDLDAWEGEGGATPRPVCVCSTPLSGTPNQMEWAEGIRRQVNDDFDRVAASFRAVADRQGEAKRADTEAIIAIIEDKRAEVMSSDQAGYFIRNWQETGDRVRQMIFQDSRYQAIKSKRLAHRAKTLNPRNG